MIIAVGTWLRLLPRFWPAFTPFFFSLSLGRTEEGNLVWIHDTLPDRELTTRRTHVPTQRSLIREAFRTQGPVFSAA